MKKERISHYNSTVCYLKKGNKVLMIKFYKYLQIFYYLIPFILQAMENIVKIKRLNYFYLKNNIAVYIIAFQITH